MQLTALSIFSKTTKVLNKILVLLILVDFANEMLAIAPTSLYQLN